MDTNTASTIVPEEIKKAFDESSKYFPTPLQQFQFFDKYSRFNYKNMRRETWVETVDRSVDFLKEISDNKLPEKDYEKIREFILEMKATPSMRLLAMAGDAAKRNNICIYNCSYLPVDSIDSWVEAMLISMCGCGVGFSVEKRNVEQLPEVKVQGSQQDDGKPVVFLHKVEDTTEGWMAAFRLGLTAWFEGEDVEFDYSAIRPAGAPLLTKGGKASGPDPLMKLMDFARKTIKNAAGRKLTPLEAHDIMCEVGSCAVSGGVRRTAMISLFDYDDQEMRHAKDGEFWKKNDQRWNANNSVVWPEDITQTQIVRQMVDMIESNNGEPGIFSRVNANRLKPERRSKADFGTNPCGEINLRPFEFCNLTIAIARPDDTFESLRDKVEVATIIGTIQSMATNFPGLREQWKKNCEEERLLGVDITGQLDCPVVQDPDVMSRLKQIAIETNRIYAKRLGIPQSASVTCVKPSGNSSQLFNCASGLHARYYPYYVRNVRVSAHSPVYKVLRDAGVPLNPENNSDPNNIITWVASFPVKSPDPNRTAKGRGAIEQCEYWLMNKKHWTEHNPSVTISYRPNEVADLIKWVVDHKDYIGGMSFLPLFEANYAQLPYIEISKEEYEEKAASFPEIDFSRIFLYEDEDLTTAAQELACMSGACEIEFNLPTSK